MSLKPLKKSDLGKSWMKPRKDRNIRIQPEYHLIVTEGTDTEPAYFEAIKTHINSCYPGRIQMEIHGEGDNTISLFEKAQRLVQESANIYKHVWVVYDTDDFPSENINKTAELCENASNSETHVNSDCHTYQLIFKVVINLPVLRPMNFGALTPECSCDEPFVC